MRLALAESTRKETTMDIMTFVIGLAIGAALVSAGLVIGFNIANHTTNKKRDNA